MPKGKHGETCAEAIHNSIRLGEVVTFTDLFTRVQPMGEWAASTIYQHLMSCVVNLPPARKHWKSKIPFLFLRPDGRYELFDPMVHPEVIE